MLRVDELEHGGAHGREAEHVNGSDASTAGAAAHLNVAARIGDASHVSVRIA